MVARKHVEAIAAVLAREAPLGSFHVSSNVPNQSLRMLFGKPPTGRTARALVTRDHFEVSGEHVAARFFSIHDEGFGQQRRSDVPSQQCTVTAFPSADFAQVILLSTKTSGVEHALKHKSEAAGPGIDTDGSVAKRFDRGALGSAH